MEHDLLSAIETCRILGISRATLYAYVSRGLLESRPGRDRRSRLYPRTDVERLAKRRQLGRGAASGAAQSLDRGLPILQTRISLIRNDGPHYRGRSALAMASAGDHLEQAARRLWDCGDRDPFAALQIPPWSGQVATIAGDATLPPLERSLAAIPLLALQVPQSFNAAPQVRHEIAARLLRQSAALLIADIPGDRPIHSMLAQAWKPDDADFAELVRLALVVCADHELNVSAFAARVVASTGAHLHATVCSGLAALSGPRHGGATARAHALIAEAVRAPSMRGFIRERWRRGDDLPGFGHALYPDGDPRAALLLAHLRRRHAGSAGLARLDRLIQVTEEISGLRPNIDGLLAAICHCNRLPAMPALVMFAAGRMAGWLAHALEQQAQGRLIRPRASYIGMPAAPEADVERWR